MKRNTTPASSALIQTCLVVLPLVTSSQFEAYSDLVDSELRRVVATRELPLYSMMGHQLGWSSEPEPDARFTPRKLGSLCLGTCATLGGKVEDALPAAAAVELVQNFCDIHDDIQSGRIDRDGRDTVWWKWGPAQAINAGDGMHALARVALLGMKERGFGPESVFEAIRVLDKASLATCEGRFMELEFQERLDVSSDSYLNMASLKTGSLFACATEFGALASGASSRVRDSMIDWGLGLGVAAQISEDLQQISVALEEDGVPSDDLMNKRKLYPVVWSFEEATARQRRQLGDYYFKRVLDPSDAKSLARLVEAVGGTAQARLQIEDQLSEAGGRLAKALQDALPQGTSRIACSNCGRTLMTLAKRSVRELPLYPGAAVLVRVDYNVPFELGTQVDFRRQQDRCLSRDYPLSEGPWLQGDSLLTSGTPRGPGRL